MQSVYFVARVEVSTPSQTMAIATFGDSITDGARSTPDADRSWPSRLARRLAANRETEHVAILNQGIGGNRILRDNTGANALARFDEDVLSPPGVKWLIVLEGINDIGQGARANALPGLRPGSEPPPWVERQGREHRESGVVEVRVGDRELLFIQRRVVQDLNSGFA